MVFTVYAKFDKFDSIAHQIIIIKFFIVLALSGCNQTVYRRSVTCSGEKNQILRRKNLSMRLLIEEEDDEKLPMLQTHQNTSESPEVANRNGIGQKVPNKPKRMALFGEIRDSGENRRARDIQGMEMAEPNVEFGGTRGAKGGGLFGLQIRRKFVLFLLGMVGLALIGLAVVILMLVVLSSLQRIDGKEEPVIRGPGSGREQFMRLYERLLHFRTSPYMITDSMISQMPEEELELAKAAGILPINGSAEGRNYSVNGTMGRDKNRSKPIGKNNDQQQGNKSSHGWHSPKCEMKCEKDDISIPPLVVLSLDGFASNYLDLDIAETLDKIAHCGARAEFMFPSYPSKTFPNHYTIATGLWPEAHGIIDNAVYDPEISPDLEDMKKAKHAKFYGGEPIWSSAVRQHKRVFCLFWPGCSFNITGYNPTIDVPYNRSFSYSKRVDKIVEWLILPAIERPSLIMGYFDQPDNVGHFHTSERQVELELTYVESVLDYLFSSLHREGILDCINLVILSDHGMQWIDHRYFFNEMLPPIPGMITTSGVIGHIYLPPNSTINGTEQILDKFSCFDTRKFNVYDRQTMPKRYHYARGSRVGDVIFDGKPGVTFYSTPVDDFHVTSDHGYDYLHHRMHAIFFARGPNIRKGTRLQPFQNVELFNLFTDLLRLSHDVPTNGTQGLLNIVLHNMDLHRSPAPFFTFEPDLHPLSECSPTTMSQPMRQLYFCNDDTGKNRSDSQDDQCGKGIDQLQQSMNACNKRQSLPPYALFYTRSRELCMINLCPAMLLTSMNEENKVSTSMLYEFLSDSDFPDMSPSGQVHRDPSPSCLFADQRFDKKYPNWTRNEGQNRNRSQEVVRRSIAAVEGADVSAFVRLQFPMYSQFANGPFRYLQYLTRHYARLYGKMVAISGTIFDEDMDGTADDPHPQKAIRSSPSSTPMPTHFFRILIRCEDNVWHLNGVNCKTASATRVLAFILPNSPKDLNCLGPEEYLLMNSARVRDVELLTGVQFFTERMWFPPETKALWWRTNITTQLWQ